MRIFTVVAMLLAIDLPVGAQEPGQSTADSLVQAIMQARHKEEEWLQKSPSSYLAAVSRRDFGEKHMLTVGRSAENDLTIDDTSVSLRHLRVDVVGDSFRVEAVDPQARFSVRGEEKRLAMVGPSAIGVGRFLVRLSHQRFPGLIVFDAESPRFREFKGLQYFPVDLSLRFILPLTLYPDPDTVIILSTRGNRRRAVHVGWFDFEVNGEPCRLEAHRLLEPGIDESGIAIFFRDGTSGKETYGLGRYIDPERLADGRFVLDLNRAYNPACAFSDHYNCPIPTAANTLTVEIRAGELDAQYMEH